MTSHIVLPRSLRIAEVFTVLLGLGLSTIAIGARIYMKLRVSRQFHSEDYFSLAGYFGFLAFVALIIVIGRNGEDFEYKTYLSKIGAMIYGIGILFVKISILLQYVTLFVVHRRTFFHYLIHVIIWVNAIYYTIVTCIDVFYCKYRRNMRISDVPKFCRVGDGRGVLTGSANVATDFLILLLPLPVILRLQVPFKKKIRLLLVFGIGLFACVASVVRLVYSLQVNVNADPKTYQLNLDRSGLWGFAEVAIGTIVGCMPSVHKCLKHIRKNATSFNLRIPYIDSTGSVWRKIFPRSNSSDTSRSPKSSGSSNNGSAAPQIDTLNMTRASLILEKKDMPKFPSAIQRKETAMGRETPSSQVMDYDTSEKVGDVERGTPASLAREQRRDDSNSERNETTRAQYEFHPRRTVY